MSELKSVFDVRKEETVLIDIPFQFIYSNNLEVWMQFGPIQIYSGTRKILLPEAGVDNRRKDKLLQTSEPQDFVQLKEFRQYVSQPDVAHTYHRFSTGTKGICQQEEDLNIEGVSSVGWTKHAHLDAANGVCSRRCLDIRRQSPYAKITNRHTWKSWWWLEHKGYHMVSSDPRVQCKNWISLSNKNKKRIPPFFHLRRSTKFWFLN